MRQKNTYKKIISWVTIFHLFVQILGGILINMFIFSPNTASAANEKVLDTLSTPAAAAYSLRKLRDAYTGPAVQVRRDLDNTTQDIGFTASGELNQEALLNFVVPNFIINSAWSGVIVGTSNGPMGSIATAPGIARQVVATGSNSITIRWYGTTTSTWSNNVFVSFTPSLSAPIGSKFVLKQDITLVAWSMANTTGVVQRIGNDGTVGLNPTSTPTTYTSSATLTSTNAQPLSFRFSATLGQPVDFTIKFDNLQMNAGSTVLPYVSSSITSYPSAFVTTWYDQSGNSKDVTQTTTTLQPRIVNNGVIDINNSKPTIYSQGIASTLVNTTTSSVKQISAVAALNSTSITTGLIGQTGVDFGIRTAGGTTAINQTQTMDFPGNSWGGTYINGGILNPSGSNATFPSTLGTPFVMLSEKVSNYSFTGISIGYYQSSARYWNGTTSEIILFGSKLSENDRFNLTKSQGNYYGVLVTIAPDVPTNVSATGWNSQATVSFTAPIDNWGSPITRYTVTSSTGGITATGITSPITVTGLTNGISYTFTVVATNAVWNSIASTASNSVTPATVPAAPTSVSATAGNIKATVSFTVPTDNGGSAITGYTVTSSLGGITATGSTSPITVTGLTNGTAYTFTVVATNTVWNSTGSTASNSVTPFIVTDRILDTLTGSAAAYSLRLLDKDYTGPAIQVRRSSDNATQDIGFAGPNLAQNRFFISDTLWNKWSGVTIWWSTVNVSGAARIINQDMWLVTGRTYRVTILANKTGVATNSRLRVTTSSSLTAEWLNQVFQAANPAYWLQIVQLDIVANNPILSIAADTRVWSGTIHFVSVQDITSGTSPTDLDEWALLNFVWTGSAFVTTWYDQSGNGKHAVQSNISKQPRIVNVGLIDMKNERPTLVFSGGQVLIWPSALYVGSDGLWTANAIFSQKFINTTSSILDSDNGTPRVAQFLRNDPWSAVSSIVFDSAANAFGTTVGMGIVDQLRIGSVIRSATWVIAFADGISWSFRPTTGIPISGAQNFSLGARANGNSAFLTGSISEAFIIPSTIAQTERQTLEKNQSQYYNIALVPSAPSAVSATGGNAQAMVSFTAPTDNGGSPITGYTVTSSPGNKTATGSTSPITVTGLTNGTAYTFTVVATNTVWNSTASTSSNSVTPIIPDTTPPTASVAYSTLLSTSGSVTATLTWASEPITITNNGGSIEYIFTAIGSFIFEFIDSFGNMGFATATVNNIDTTPPVITLSGSTSVTIAHGSSYTDLWATWSDNMDGTGSIIASGTVNTNALWTYTLTYNKTDAAGNSATTVTRTVTVTDQTAPVITLNGNASVSVAQNSSYTDAWAVWTDNIDSGGNIVANGSVDTSTLGTYTLTYDVTDTAGNIAVQKTRTVTVIDQESPTATVSYSSVLPTNTSVVATLTGESEPITITNNSGNPTYTFTNNGTFTFEFIDASWNTGSATATVTNIDTTVPTAMVSYSSVLPTNTSVVATLTWESEPITITNNGGSSTYTFTSNGTFTFEFTDASGNTGSATATVTNIDTTAPTATVSYDTLLSTSGSVVATLTWESEPITITNNSGNPTYTFTNNGTFTFEFTDAAGNTGSATATVTNIDTIAPDITLVGDSNISVFRGSSYTDLWATWSDNADGTGSLIASGSVDTSLLGSFPLTYDKTDTAGNTATTVTRTVTVLAVPVVQNTGWGGGWWGGPSNSNVHNIDTVASSLGSQKIVLETNTKDTVHADKNWENNTEKSSENNIVDTTTTFLQDMGEKVSELLGVDTSSPETELNSAQTWDSTQALVFEVVPQQEKEFVSVPREYNRCLSLELLQINPNDMTNYSDISESPYKRSIQKLEQAGVINAVKQNKTNEIFYVPKQAVTRAEFIKVLLRTHCQEYTQESEDTIPFSDLSIGTWQYDVMRKAKNLGLIAWYDDGTFRPDETITKIEALKIMLRMALQKVSDGKSEEYSDISEDWQKRYIYQSLRAGILPSSEESLFRPNTTLSREEFADMVLKLVQIYD
jgi:trimeric autotransporter adhesin